MSLIEKLTDEQIARFPEFVERWTKIGLCTDPADRPRVEAAIREMALSCSHSNATGCGFRRRCRPLMRRWPGPSVFKPRITLP
jgi:hypothetical protein